MKSPKRVFFFHYNKPASLSAKSPKMTIHWKGVCHIVDYIACDVPTYTYHNKRQPHVVLKGKAAEVSLVKMLPSGKINAYVY